MFFKAVDEWGWKLLVNSFLFCYHNQPGKKVRRKKPGEL